MCSHFIFPLQNAQEASPWPACSSPGADAAPHPNESEGLRHEPGKEPRVLGWGGTPWRPGCGGASLAGVVLQFRGEPVPMRELPVLGAVKAEGGPFPSQCVLPRGQTP